jgi:CelD/BcsL family acetyltransferase involved in cellulose biosynthesis
VRIEVVHPHELGPAELAAWRRMQREDPALGSPFLAPEFTQAVGRVRADARVAVLEDGQDLGGFFAFHRVRFGRGLPIGAGLADAQALIHARGMTWDPRELLRACGLAVWEFDHLLAAQVPFAPYHVSAARSPTIDLTAGYEAYLAGRRGASERVRVALRKARKLARERGEIRFELQARDRRAFGQVLEWKSAQYRRTGRGDRFSRPWIAGLVDALYDQEADGCAGSLSLLWVGDELVAGHFGLRSERVLASWFPAYDTAAASYSPGWLLFLRMAEAGAAGGVQAIDLGKGEEDYKQSLKTGNLALAEGWVSRPSVRALARAAQRAPRRRVTRFVLERPRLRLAARRALREIGRLHGAG